MITQRLAGERGTEAREQPPARRPSLAGTVRSRPRRPQETQVSRRAIGGRNLYRRLARSMRPMTLLTGFGLSVLGTYFRQKHPGNMQCPQ
jgi:hypothetical protein